MSLQIVKVVAEEKQDEEFVRLKATASVNLENYAIVDNTYSHNGGVSNIHRHFYRFPNKLIAKGDYVRLYTGKGEPKTILNKDGKYSVHYLYWGSEAGIWNKKIGDVVELLKVQSISRATVLKKENDPE